jgi:hypothetical protein
VSDEQVYYRIVRDWPPTRRDFLTYRELGVRTFAPVTDERLLDGITEFDDLVFLEREALGPWNRKGDSIVEIKPNQQVIVDKTGGPHHYAMSGPTEELEKCCTRRVSILDRATKQVRRTNDPVWTL